MRFGHPSSGGLAALLTGLLGILTASQGRNVRSSRRREGKPRCFKDARPAIFRPALPTHWQ
jgi:hypothetical protein